MSATFILTVISHTPVWVWGLLLALIALGLHQARDHVVTPARLLLQPLTMGAFACWGAVQAFGWHAHVLAAWVLGSALGLALNRWLALPRQAQALPDGRFAIGGSWAPLALIVGVFMLRYVASVALVLTPQLKADLLFGAVACALYGLSIGVLAARAARVWALRERASGLAAA